MNRADGSTQPLIRINSLNLSFKRGLCNEENFHNIIH